MKTLPYKKLLAFVTVLGALFTLIAYQPFWTIKYRVDNAHITKYHPLENNSARLLVPDTPAPNTRADGTVQGTGRLHITILLLAYYRTGSTLTGAILSAYPGSFYVFEPLQVIINDTFLINGSTIKYNKEGIHTLVKNALTCNIGDYPLHILMRKGIDDSLVPMRECLYSELMYLAIRKRQTHVLSKLAVPHRFLLFKITWCRQVGFCVSKREREKMRQKCLQRTQIIKHCQNAPVRIFKFIRLSFDDTIYWMNNDRSLKLVTLLRDPRGYVTSHIQLKKTDVPRKIAKDYCSWIRSVTNGTKNYLHKRPNRSIYKLQYEDLAMNPISTTRNMYSYLGIPFVPEVKEKVWNLTMSGEGDENCEYCVNRGNGTKKAIGWKKKITRSAYYETYKQCSDVIRTMGFEMPLYENLRKNRYFFGKH